MGYYGYLDQLFLPGGYRNKLQHVGRRQQQQQQQQQQQPAAFLSSMKLISLRIPYISSIIPRLHIVYGLFTSLRVESKTCNGQCRRRRKNAWERFVQFLKENGLLEEFQQGFLNLPFGVFLNMVFLQRIQQVQADQIRNNNIHEFRLSNGNILSKTNLEEVQRMMGYCTMSYGSSMINAVVSAKLAASAATTTTRNNNIKRRTSSNIRLSSLLIRPAKSQRENLVRYNGYSVELLVDNPSLDTEYTGHFLVLDHKNKEVCLTIRGTFSIADLLTDLDVRTVPFCGGYAAIGFVTMANNIWTLLEDHVTTMMPENYRLIICGHSLGGAVATLLTIKILFEQRLQKNTDIHCHAFGSPPVFGCVNNETGQPTEEGRRALALVRPHITNYIHHDDTVPFLRPLEVRKANAALCLMDQTRTSIISWSLWWRILFGTKAATNELQEAFDKIRTTHAYNCYPNRPEDTCMSDLKWASCRTIWLRKTKSRTSSDGYNYQATIHPHGRRTLLLHRGLLATRTMIHDHMPIAYESAIRNCLKDPDTST